MGQSLNLKQSAFKSGPTGSKTLSTMQTGPQRTRLRGSGLGLTGLEQVPGVYKFKWPSIATAPAPASTAFGQGGQAGGMAATNFQDNYNRISGSNSYNLANGKKRI